MNILVTGGAGYIGSHAAKRLIRDGHTVVILDNLSRGRRAAVEALQTLPGAAERLAFHECSIADRPVVESILCDHAIDAILHFAAFAYVGESVHQPLEYYRNNTAGTLALIEACDAARIRRFVFSSTCATYGEPPPERIPIREDCPQNPINPYGYSKLAVERILLDYAAKRNTSDAPFACALLRYFNVAGADREGLIGEDHDPETHLIPLILQAALGIRPHITIFGTDYPTPDGTCIRDYIHVEDLVDAHVLALSAMKPGDPQRSILRYNLGIGRGVSVREAIDAAERVTGRTITVVEGQRRAGDPPVLYADPGAILRDLGWKASITDLDQIIATAWRWFEAHPRGYDRPSTTPR